MPIGIKVNINGVPECPGCRRYMDTGDFFHDKEEWNTYHNCGWIDGKSDWQPREELTEMLVHMKDAWEKSRKMRREFLENYVAEHGHLPQEISDWKLNKIISKRGLK